MKKKKSNMSNRKKRERIFIISFLIFPILQFLVFWVFVNYKSIFMGLSNMTTGFDWGKANWTKFVGEWNREAHDIQISLKNSIIYFVVCNFINLPLTVIFAYFLFKKCIGHKFFRVVFFLPSIIGSVVFCTLFRFFVGTLGSNKGVVLSIYERIINLFGAQVDPTIASQGLLASPDTAFPTIMLEILWTGMGMGLVLIAGGLARIPKDIFEAGRVDGASMWHEFIHIVIPLLLPTITSCFILNMAGLFTFYAPVMILTEGSAQTSTIGWYITRFTLHAAKTGSSAIGSSLNYPAFVGLLATIVAVPAVLLIKKFLDKITPDASY